MKMQWEKLGKIFEPNGTLNWAQSRAMVPLLDHIERNLYRIYFTTCDAQSRSHIGWILVDMENPFKVLDISPEPVLGPGELGTFDDSGTTATCLINVEEKKYLYYVGWNLGITVPFRNSIGLAISDDNGCTFKKVGFGPIVERNYKEPHFVASPFVLYEQGFFKLWYASCVRWVIEDDKPKHYYHIKYAESKNGIDWERKGMVAIDFKNEQEHAVAVPRVLHEDEIYKMWYCYRGQKYRIGYAESKDGVSWERKDDLMDFTVSGSGWDSEMVEYPFIFDYKMDRYMLYNGNHYGSTGFGLARLRKINK